MWRAVLIPVRDKDVAAGEWRPAVSYFARYHVPVFILVNGPDAIHCSARTEPGCKFFYAGKVYNPYAARNVGLSAVFNGSFPADYAILTDADCRPDEDYLDRLAELVAKQEDRLLIAGRTRTEVPTGTRHFDLLRAAGFECYDGFTPPDHTVGSNMVIGRRVYKQVGPMRDTHESGGDGLYGMTYQRLGGQVTVGEKLWVTKRVAGMSFKGIVEKQFRRACCFPPAMVPSLESVLKDLTADLKEVAAHCATPASLMTAYPQAIDRMFKLCMRLGLLHHHLDKESSHAAEEYGRSDTDPE
jgi:hypothetical protein